MNLIDLYIYARLLINTVLLKSERKHRISAWFQNKFVPLSIIGMILIFCMELIYITGLTSYLFFRVLYYVIMVSAGIWIIWLYYTLIGSGSRERKRRDEEILKTIDERDSFESNSTNTGDSILVSFPDKKKENSE